MAKKAVTPTISKVYKPPVVTVMGHVDHGKTTLLDSIRHANVADKEFGGITQKIGGYQVEFKGKKITFIDTPGHEAFSEMRARGVSVTDIIVLVVAADDGVQNQTREVINLYKKSTAHLIVAVNKIDMPGANPDRVKRELASEGLSLEGWGGDIPVVEISAKNGTNIDNLLENILLVAELTEIDMVEPYAPLAANDYIAEAVIIESYNDKALGPVATCIVKAGTIKRGEYMIAGATYGRVRALIDPNNKTVDHADLSDPILIVGLPTVQNTGEIVRTYATDKLARQHSEKSVNDQIQEEVNNLVEAVEIIDEANFFDDVEQVSLFRIILKTDTKGSMDAIISSMEKMHVEGINIKIQAKSIGAVTLSDIDYANSTKSIIIAFNTEVPKALDQYIREKKVLVREYRIIYQLLEEIEGALLGLMMPEEEEVIIGNANVKSIFVLSNKNIIAGCEVKNGKIIKGYRAYVERKGEKMHDAKITSLRHLKDEVKEVSVGQECGILLEPTFEIQTGDKIVVYKLEKL